MGSKYSVISKPYGDAWLCVHNDYIFAILVLFYITSCKYYTLEVNIVGLGLGGQQPYVFFYVVWQGDKASKQVAKHSAYIEGEGKVLPFIIKKWK